MNSLFIDIRLFLAVLTGLAFSLACNPEKEYVSGQEVNISFSIDGEMVTKSSDPGPDRINDINLFVVNKEGIVEDNLYYNKDDISAGAQMFSCHIRLLRNMEYSIYAFANTGYKIKGILTLEDLKSFRYYMTYPDEYSRGMAMCGKAENLLIKDFNDINISLERVMARISVRVDRTRLESGISFNVRSIRIGNCPKSVNMSGQSRAQNNMDVFNMGFMKSYEKVDALNIDERPGLSGEVSVYMLENMNGDLLPEAINDRDKVLNTKPAMAEVCSYIEIKAEYYSKELASKPEEFLIYRFYLGSGKDNFDVERNCHYHFTIRPEGSGLQENSWRVDKSGLGKTGKAKITLHPSDYIEGKVGESIHVWAEVEPENAFFNVGHEELEYDKERGIYDYKIDEDGHGVTLSLKSKGSGILYFEASYPPSDAAAAVIVVN